MIELRLADLMTSAPSKFVEFAKLQTLRHYRFAPRGRIEGVYAGRHLSRQRGGASEFADYREYTAGEDLRRLDWKVLARTGRPYVRLFQNETELSCTMLIDASRSMTFAGADNKPEQSKLTYVQFLASAVSQLIQEQRDRVGLAVVGRKLEAFHSPTGTPGQVRLIQAAIETIRPANGTDLAGPLRGLFGRLTRRGVLLVISDFLIDDLAPMAAALRLFKHKRWDVILLHIVHPQEEKLVDGLAYRFEGLEGDGTVDCSPADVAKGYQQRFEAHARAVRAAAVGAGCDYRRLSTAVPYAEALRQFLVETGA